MGLLDVYEALRGAGYKLVVLIQGQPVIETLVNYIKVNPWTTLGVVAGSVITYHLITRPRNLPPGPFNIPFFGATSLLGENSEEEILKMCQQYGDLMYFKRFGTDTVILNSEKIIREAYVKRGDEFAHRKMSHFFNLIGVNKDEFFSVPYNEEYKAVKKFIVVALKQCGFRTMKSEVKINSGIDKLVRSFIEQNGQPFSTLQLLKTSNLATAFSIFFNEDLPLDDPKVGRLVTMIEEWSTSLFMGMPLCDITLDNAPSIVRRIYCQGIIKEGRRTTKVLMDYFLGIIREHRATLDATEVRDIVDYFLAHRSGIDDDTVACDIVFFITDSVEMTSLLMSWVLFFICHHEDVQKKLKLQVDSVIGRNRNPSISDKPNLAYAEAIVLETIRCADIIKMGSARLMKTDVELGGYTIPKGFSAMANHHASHYDPEIFPQPQNFDPSRFLDTSGQVNSSLAGKILTFSTGRRMCSGEAYVKSTLFMTLVRIAQKFDMTFDPGEPKPPLDVTSMMPPDHKICMIPRK